MARNFMEALLSGLGGGMQQYGDQTRENDLLNLRRQDAVSQFLMEMADRRRRDAQTQANWQRSYDLDIKQDKDRSLKDYMTRTLGMLNAGADDVALANYRRDSLGERTRHNKAMEGVGMTREGRLSRPGNPKSRPSTSFSAFFGGRKAPVSLANPAMQAVQASGVQPLAQFSDPNMSAVAKLNQPDPQAAFRAQVPPDFDSWDPEDQQAAWEMWQASQGAR